MIQDVQLLKTEIIADLDRLPPDSLSLLAKFVAFLRSNGVQSEISKINESIEVNAPSRVVRMTSPRLVHRHQIADFQKEMVEIESDDSL